MVDINILSQIEGLLFSIEESVKKQERIAASIINDLIGTRKDIERLSDYAIINKKEELISRIAQLKVSILYVITPNMINPQNYREGSIEEVRGLFRNLHNGLNHYYNMVNKRTENSVIDLYEEFDIESHIKRLTEIYGYCIAPENSIFKMGVDKDTFFECVKKADFSSLYYKDKSDSDIKINKKADFKSLIYAMSSLLGDNWYGKSAKSIGHTKRDCSGANSIKKYKFRKFTENK